MEEKVPEWWQQTTGGQTGQMKTSTVKWYNDSTKLMLSAFIWPVLIYGLYKTDLISKRNKQIGLAVIVILFLLAGLLDSNNQSTQ